MQKIQYDQYDGDNDQNMDPTSGFREARTDPPTEKAKQPQDYENYNDNPKQRHEISPFERPSKRSIGSHPIERPGGKKPNDPEG